MHHLNVGIKKIITPFFLSLTLVLAAPLQAQEPLTSDEEIIPPCKPPEGTLTEQYLFCIRQYTNGVLQKVNTMPEYIKAASAYFLNMTSSEESKESVIPQMQENFTNLANQYITNAEAQKNMQSQLVSSFFRDPSDPTGKTLLDAKRLMNANDLTYQTLLGKPFLDPDPRKQEDPSIDPSSNYIINASSLNVQHVIPNPTWQPKELIQKQRYFSYYSTVSAAQTYNSYILSELLANQKSDFKLNEIQKQLMESVSGATWLKQVGSDNIGLIFRHVLLFDSQMFVLLARLVEVQKQMLISQAITNSLLVALNLGNEDMLVKKANGTLTLP